MSPRFDRFIGVDFSGGRKAGDAIWIAEGVAGSGGLTIDSLRRARDLPQGGQDRAAALAALRGHLASREGALIGLDFPFSLPGDLIDAPDWPGFARDFTTRHPDAEQFRASCRRRTGGKELKRRTDRRTATPFCAYNLRLYRQTYWGIAAVLAPLVGNGRVAIVPMQRQPGASVTLAETCPASTLKRLDCYRPYKGRDPALTVSRRGILDRLRREGLRIGEALAACAVEDRGGDALDAVIAAMTMWRVAGMPGDPFQPRDEIDALEARVYAWPLEGA